MKRFFQQLAALTRFELQDAIRSRRAAVVLLLYLAAALVSTNGFISTLQNLETQLAEILQLDSGSPGAMADALWKSARFRNMIGTMIGDKEVAQSLMGIPPIALLYGFLAFFYTPFFVLLTASPRVAGDVWTGAARFVLFRTSRAAWVLGKMLGQAALLLLALALGAACSWCLARFRLQGMNGAAAAAGMALLAGKAWLFSLPFLGLALGISQSVRSPNTANALGFVAWLATWVLTLTAKHFAGDGLHASWEVVLMLMPQGYQLDLWRAGFVAPAMAALFLLSLGAAYLSAGYALFSRRDL
jgi:ABC-type transport system involved in multi-copper enzyme maturation permease subunit